MKRLFSALMIAVMAFGFALTASAKGTCVKPSQVPASIQAFVKANFAPAKIVSAEKEIEKGCVSYELKLSDGVKIEITEGGEWVEVDAINSSSAVPPTIIGEKMMKYVIMKYPGNEVLKIENDEDGYELTLGDGTELEFDQAFNFIRVDNN